MSRLNSIRIATPGAQCYRNLFVKIAALIILTACSTIRQPGLLERDLYVVNTPEYPDNRVYYLGPFDEVSYSSLLFDKYQAIKQSKDTDPKQGDSLSIVVNSVTLPAAAEQNPERIKTRDIVVILDVIAENSRKASSIVVWYQRGVYDGQSLNFSNLLVYQQESWDERVPPLFRIRVMDIASENNLETREALAEVSKYGGAIALALRNPAVSPMIETAVRAASLVFANKNNKLLLDYTVQFYRSTTVLHSDNAFLSPLKKGRFLLIGRDWKSLKDRNYWRHKYSYDEVNLDVIDSTKNPLRTPVVVISVSTDEMIVPPFVADKSAYLTRLLTETTNMNLDQVQEESKELHQRIDFYVLKERVRRYRSVDDMENLIERLKDAPTDILESNMRMLRSISGCQGIRSDNYAEWWDQNAAKARFSDDDFKLEDVVCPQRVAK